MQRSHELGDIPRELSGVEPDRRIRGHYYARKFTIDQNISGERLGVGHTSRQQIPKMRQKSKLPAERFSRFRRCRPPVDASIRAFIYDSVKSQGEQPYSFMIAAAALAKAILSF
jgi:hypothetical protein